MAKTIFNLGKIPFSSISRKNNLVEVEMELNEDKQGRLIVSFSGSIWNATKSDIVAGGQIRRLLDPYLFSNPVWGIINYLWGSYHLNHLHAGTPKQEDYLTLWKSKNNLDSLDYDVACRLLEEAGLLEDNGYKYGTSWLYREIPEKDLYLIQTLQKFF